jgi:hypothetical protein
LTVNKISLPPLRTSSKPLLALPCSSAPRAPASQTESALVPQTLNNPG